MNANEATFQSRVHAWVRKAFGQSNAMDVPLRTHRFVEEALELAQATGCSRKEVLRIAEYVYGRPVGKVHQEIGGVQVTLNALCSSLGWLCDLQGETELHRISKITEKDPQYFQDRSNSKPDFTKASVTDETNYGGYLQLHSGTRWDIENPTTAMVSILDIAESLSKQCRFAGHITHFYSVAEHSVYVAEEIAKHFPVNFELQLLGLLHDATESILVDIPRPIKKYLKGYYELELKTWKPIAECFRLSHYKDPLCEPAVMNADNAVLLAEKEQIVPSKEPWAWAKDIPAADVMIRCVTPKQAKSMFLAKFVTLTYMRSQSQC